MPKATHVAMESVLRVRIGARDIERLQALAAHHELPVGTMVRLLIRHAAEALEAEAA